GVGAAQAVDDRQHLFAAAQVELGAQGVDQQLDQPVGVGEGYALGGALPVDADAELDLVVPEGELGLVVARMGAGRQRQAHGAGAGGGAAADVGDLFQARPGLGGGPAQLLDDHGGGGAAAAGPGLVTGVGGQIVVDQHHLGGDLVVAADLAGDAEVQHVAGVVLDDLDHAAPGVGGLGGLQHLQRGGAGEHGTGDRDIEAARPDEAGVQGLVAGSAAGDQADLVPGSLPARDEAVLLVQLELQRIAEHESFERFGDQVLGIVDDAATHGLSFPEGRGSGPEG